MAMRPKQFARSYGQYVVGDWGKGTNMRNIIAAILLVAALGFVQSKANPSEQSAGRYQLQVPGNSMERAYLLDTQTGRVWERTMYTDIAGSPSVWLYDDRIDNDQQRAAWEGRHTPAPSQ
jgi:hypothetical protein